MPEKYVEICPKIIAKKRKRVKIKNSETTVLQGGLASIPEGQANVKANRMAVGVAKKTIYEIFLKQVAIFFFFAYNE